MTHLIRTDHTFILAEVAQAYEGSVDTLVTIATTLCRTGLDGIMFQVVFAEELVVPKHACYALFQSLEMPTEQWRRVITAIHAGGKRAIAEVFGRRSVDLMMELGIDGFKLHAADLTNLDLLQYIGTTQRPVLLAVGGGAPREIADAIASLRAGGAPEIVLMHGYQACPTAIEDSHVLKLRALAGEFGLPVGYSDHIAGCVGDYRTLNTSALSFPLLAIGAGAVLIEKHVMLDRQKAWEDHESALSVEEFGAFVTLMRTAHAALGRADLSLNAVEAAYGARARKYLVAATQIPTNTILRKEHIAFKRIPDISEGIVSIQDVLGKKILTDLTPDEAIRTSMIEKKGVSCEPNR